VSAYLIVEVEVQDPETYASYRAQVAPTLEPYGGRFLVRGGEARTLEGDWQPARLVVLEFDSRERALAWWSSPEYAGPKVLRQRSARTRMVCVDGIA